MRPHPKVITKHPTPAPHRAAVHQQQTIQPHPAPQAVTIPQQAPAYVPPAATAASFGNGGGTFAASGPIAIPAILSLTGPGAFIGNTISATLKVIENAVNSVGGIGGRPVAFQISDDQTSPQLAVQMANTAIARSPVVIGSDLSATCGAMAPLFANGPIDWCLSPATTPPRGSSVFTTSISVQDDLAATVHFCREKGWTRLAVLATTDASGQFGEQAFDQALSSPDNQRMLVVDRETFAPADISVVAQIATVRASGPQALIVLAAGTPLGTALHGIHDEGLAVPIATSTANMVPQQLRQYAAFLPSELYFPSAAYVVGAASSQLVRQAQATYNDAMKANGMSPDALTGAVWDAGLIVVDALRKLGPTATSAQIHAYLANLRGWPGIFGVYDFTKYPQRGLGADAVVMVQWNGSAFVAVSSFGGALR